MDCKKRTYKTHEQAMTASVKISLDLKSYRQESRLIPYKCPNCHGFHLTGPDNTLEEKKKMAEKRAFIKAEAEYWIKKKPKRKK